MNLANSWPDHGIQGRAVRTMLEEARNETFTDYNDPSRTGAIQLFRGLSEERLKQFTRDVGVPLPDDVLELLSFTGGFSLFGIEVSFAGSIQHPEALPNARFLTDGATEGDWVIEFSPETHTWGDVWYLCYDPRGLFFQCAGLALFIEAVLDLFRSNHSSILAPVFVGPWPLEYRRLKDLPYAFDTRDFEDPVLRDFAATLLPNARVADLRGVQPNCGIQIPFLSRKRPLVRCGEFPIFGIPPRKGLLRWLLGR